MFKTFSIVLKNLSKLPQPSKIVALMLLLWVMNSISVQDTSTRQLEYINEQILQEMKSAQFDVKAEQVIITEDYKKNVRHLHTSGSSALISSYDELLQKYSDHIGWDWRLLASMVYQESKFDPNARSSKGAFGIMQMMPSTGAMYGIDSTSSVEEQIAASVRYLSDLNKIMTRVVPNEEERIKFILASYNAGPGHILDAVRLAQKEGKIATVWDNNVDSCLLSKANPEVYNQPEVRNGYCRGEETFSYVRKVMAQYQRYKTIAQK